MPRDTPKTSGPEDGPGALPVRLDYLMKMATMRAISMGLCLKAGIKRFVDIVRNVHVDRCKGLRRITAVSG